VKKAAAVGVAGAAEAAAQLFAGFADFALAPAPFEEHA